MPISGVYFIPSNPNSTTALGTITERLCTTLADEHAAVGRWALEHKLMRDTPSCLPASASQRPTQPRYMQFLSISHYPAHGFIYTSEAEEMPPSADANNPNPNPNPNQPDSGPGPGPDRSPMVMTTVPLQSYSMLFQHFVYACQPFWCHRHTVAVPNGFVYDVGDFRVRIGDVRQTQPTGRTRGTVVKIEWRGPSLIDSILAQSPSGRHGKPDTDADSGIEMAPSDIADSDVDAEYAATARLIREFWARLGVEGAREAILVPGLGKEVKERLTRWKRQEHKQEGQHSDDGGEQQDADVDAGADEARQFMEIFRFNR
ncbi:hypothetical protein PHISP_02302 [Aspergillus sp. HF37]|nr:hypothetical protein PHISP_02302 [Aspergillus sp. HF37]